VIRVLDLTDGSGAFFGRLMVGLGAEVIVIEPPGGDPLRHAHPDGLPFVHWRAGTRSVVLDLDDSRDRDRFRRLVPTADIVVETFMPGRLAALDLAWPQLREIRPELVLVSITPFGQTGPRASWRGTDLTAVAMGGMMTLCGDPDGPPLAPPREQAYHLASVHAAVGALAALRARRRSGRGQHVDVAMQEAVAATLEYGAIAFIHAGVVPRRQGSRHPYVPHKLLHARDGLLAGGLGGNPRMWGNLVAWMSEVGKAADLDDPRWQDEKVRLREREHVFEVIESFTRSFAKADFYHAAQQRRLPWASVDDARDVRDNPHFDARRFFVDVVSDGRAMRDVGFAFGFPKGRRPERLVVPALGEGNEAILANLAERIVAGRETGSASSTRGALAGLRVLDLTWVLAGPYATRLLADHGADVIKVESRHRPDPTRFAASLFLSRHPVVHPDRNGYFNNHNRSKRSLALNLNLKEAREILARLVRHSDVVIENFSPRVMAGWGLDYTGLCAIRPDIILVSMSGLGHTGPWRDYVTYADALAALSGLTAQAAFPGRDPVGTTFGLGDMMAGLHAALGTLAALEHRDATGEGQHVDLSQVEAVATHTGTSLLEVAAGHVVGARGNRHHTMVPHGAFRCRGDDRWLAIAVATDDEWRALCTTMGCAELAADARFATAAGRKLHEDLVEEYVAGWTRDRDAHTAMGELQGKGIAAGVVADARDLVEGDPHLRARGYFERVAHPVVGEFLHEGVVPRLSDTPGRVWHAAPTLGQHTRAILADVLGLTDAEITRGEKEGLYE
jgi:crotonobetainyl-CoA:carnitine CoA-transferase CaiB-like acyl-CoA transferase